MNYLTILIFTLTLVSADELAIQEFTNANNLFAAASYKEIVKSATGNFLTSPFSVETVLAFAEFGCGDETAQEIRTSLHLPNNKSKIHAALKSLLPTLTNDDYKLYTANKMYVKENVTIKEEFKKAASEVYHAEIENIDFSQQTEAAIKINDWVARQTENKIQNLIDSSDLNNQTRTVLINSLYFKGNWTDSFRTGFTYKQSFYKTTKDVIQVDMMHSEDTSYKYYECSEVNAKFLEIHFQGENAFMTIILPNEKEGLSNLENQIDKIFTPHPLKWQVVNVALPKFKIESQIDFNNILQNLGVKKAFDEKEADLSGIAGERGDLVIDKVQQKTFIDVSEGGVEGAAATVAVMVVPMSGFTGEIELKNFIADHPFIFYIKVKGLIMFAGRVSVPNQ